MTAGTFRLAFVAAALLATSAGFGQVPAPHAKDAPPVSAPATELPPASSQPATPSLTAEDLSAFFDGMFPSAMATGDIAGAVVVVVKDDRVVLSKAYGYSDMEKRTPVSAEKTLFRPGSISKLFTWTAVMQLVEAGKIDLDHDINEYLDFRIEGYGGKPITVRHLLTHTPGFEERLKDLLVTDIRQLKPLEVVLKEGTPARIYPPGAVPAYSNYGAALGGYIVQRVSGMPYDDYIEQKIFAPLGMHDSTFRQPVPEKIRSQLSNGYLQASGDVVPYEICPDAPAGSLSASGADMANFMLAHLNGGALPAVGDSSRILSPETTQLMHSVSNTVAKGIDAMALGFYEQSRNDVRAIAHGGDLTAFHSDLILFEQAKVGLYVSFNSVGRNHSTYALRTALTEGFADRYFPRTQKLADPAPVAGAKERAEAVAAHAWELSRRAEKNLFSFAYMLGQTGAQVTEKGNLEFEALTGLNEQPREFQEISPWYWREVGGEMRFAALRDANGALQAMVPDGYGPIFIFQPVPGWRAKSWLQPAVVLAAVVLAIGIGSWLIGGVRRFAKRRRDPALAPAARAPRWVFRARLASLACLVFLVLIGSILVMFSGDSFWVLTDPAVPFLRLVQLAALLAVIGAVVAVIGAVWSWREPGERLTRSIGRSATALACLICAYVAVAFHFLTVTLNY